VPYPRGTWLSPLHRRTTFFHLTEEPSPQPSNQWLIDRDALATARLEVTPEIDAGCAVVSYEMADVPLRKYLVERARQAQSPRPGVR